MRLCELELKKPVAVAHHSVVVNRAFELKHGELGPVRSALRATVVVRNGADGNTIEAIRQEITREVEQFLRVVFEDRRTTGRLDLEATQMAMRSAATPGGRCGVEPTTRIPSSDRAKAHAALPLRPTSPPTASSAQAGADRRGPGGSFAPLLFMRALRRRPISDGRRTGYREYGIPPGVRR